MMAIVELGVIGVAAVALGGVLLVQRPRGGPVSTLVSRMRPSTSHGEGRGGRRTMIRLAQFGAWCLVGAAVAFVVTWVFGIVTKIGPLARIDTSILRWFVLHRSPELTSRMTTVTELASYRTIWIVGAIIGVSFSIRDRSVIPIVLVVVAILGLKVMQTELALLVDKNAPPATIAVGSPSGFPSGGAARVLVVFGLGAALATERGGPRLRAIAWTVAGLAVWGVVLSRLYLALHFPTDVAGGLVLGALWLLVLATGKVAFFPARSPAGAVGS